MFKLLPLSLKDITLYLYQRRCQQDPVSLPSGRLEKRTRSSPHHVAQHRPTGSETTTPYAPGSSRFGSEPPSVEDDVDVWRYAILKSCMPEKKGRQRTTVSNSVNYILCSIVFSPHNFIISIAFIMYQVSYIMLRNHNIM